MSLNDVVPGSLKSEISGPPALLVKADEKPFIQPLRRHTSASNLLDVGIMRAASSPVPSASPGMGRSLPCTASGKGLKPASLRTRRSHSPSSSPRRGGRRRDGSTSPRRFRRRDSSSPSASPLRGPSPPNFHGGSSPVMRGFRRGGSPGGIMRRRSPSPGPPVYLRNSSPGPMGGFRRPGTPPGAGPPGFRRSMSAYGPQDMGGSPMRSPWGVMPPMRGGGGGGGGMPAPRWVIEAALRPDVRQRFELMFMRGLIHGGDLDPACISFLEGLPPHSAMQVLDEFSHLDLFRIRSPTGFFIGICKRVAARGGPPLHSPIPQQMAMGGGGHMGAGRHMMGGTGRHDVLSPPPPPPPHVRMGPMGGPPDNGGGGGYLRGCPPPGLGMMMQHGYGPMGMDGGGGGFGPRYAHRSRSRSPLRYAPGRSPNSRAAASSRSPTHRFGRASPRYSRSPSQRHGRASPRYSRSRSPPVRPYRMSPRRASRSPRSRSPPLVSKREGRVKRPSGSRSPGPSKSSRRERRTKRPSSSPSPALPVKRMASAAAAAAAAAIAGGTGETGDVSLPLSLVRPVDTSTVVLPAVSSVDAIASGMSDTPPPAAAAPADTMVASGGADVIKRSDSGRSLKHQTSGGVGGSKDSRRASRITSDSTGSGARDQKANRHGSKELLVEDLGGKASGATALALKREKTDGSARGASGRDEGDAQPEEPVVAMSEELRALLRPSSLVESRILQMPHLIEAAAALSLSSHPSSRPAFPTPSERALLNGSSALRQAVQLLAQDCLTQLRSSEAMSQAGQQSASGPEATTSIAREVADRVLDTLPARGVGSRYDSEAGVELFLSAARRAKIGELTHSVQALHTLRTQRV